MHPLVGDLSDLSNEDLNKKYTELMAKFNQAHRFGPTSVIPQMQLVLENYRHELEKRSKKLMEDMDKKADKYKGIIDIQ
jgi:hypothetical protein